MGRAILAVLTGYLVMALVVIVLFTGTFLALGDERSYQPGTYEVSTLFIAIVVPASFAAAVLGGFVCRAVARRPKPVKALAILVAILGAAEAVYLLSGAPEPEPRTESVGVVDAGGKSRQPTWMTIANPIIGVVGVLIGGCALGCRCEPEREADQAS